jgi:hypothetical protein
MSVTILDCTVTVIALPEETSIKGNVTAISRKIDK